MTGDGRAPRWRRLGGALLDEWRHDKVPDLAASVAFYSILSLFPAVIAGAAVLGLLDSFVGADLAADVRNEAVDFLETVLTDEASQTIDAVADLFGESRPGVLTISLLTAVWALSRGFAALIRALDAVYDLDDLRPWAKIRGAALLLALGSLLAGVVLLAILVVGPLFGSGEEIAAEVGLGDQFVFVWDVLRLPLAFVVLVLWAATIFHIAPDHHTPWRDDLPGAVVTGVLWLLFTAGLRLYVEVAQSGNAVFGALGGALIVLMWFWLLALAVMIGGEVNQVLLSEGSDPVQSAAERAHELAGLDRAPAVEEDPHDG